MSNYAFNVINIINLKQVQNQFEVREQVSTVDCSGIWQEGAPEMLFGVLVLSVAGQWCSKKAHH